MIVRNIYKEQKAPLELFKDDRGIITDIFYKEDIHHVAQIDSEPNVIRGNHYHKETTQHMLMISGSMEYWYKNVESDEEPKVVLLKKGDLVSTPPLEIHTLKIGNDGNSFVVFSSGLRGGKDYEADTFRVDSII
jgi:dTDP-4-dehydrorhamnose 3,5-epimerase-like enzyme